MLLDILARVLHEFAYRLDLLGRPGTGLFYAVKDKQDPGAPGLFSRDVQEQTIVVTLVLNDVTTQIKNRGVEQTLFDQKQDIQDPSGTAITVSKRVNCLELVMLDSHFDQRVDLGVAPHETLPVLQFLDQDLLAGRRRVNELSCRPVFEIRSRISSNIQLHIFDSTAYLYCHIRGKHAPAGHLAAFEQGRAVA